ncbi:M56 family metallopeptidase [Streptomyces sp. NPDC004267]|uniref:M56 family metallopeptidase n=1 Tax=Streptomyces sp. NPDC004267 TaxID=3364694 RepID=UPI0036821D58
MRIDVYLPLALSLLLAAVAPRVGGRIAPALAARALAAAALLTATATTWALVLLAVTLVGDTREGGGRTVPEPVPESIGIAALLALAVLAYRLLRTLRSETAGRRALRRLCAGHPGDTELIVADSAVPRAFAIPATRRAPGRILVTSAMLAALQPAERRALLAHERAHLTHRHALIATGMALAIAVNPLLAPVGATVSFLAERWADESAAGAVGDRTTKARAIARAALVAHRPRPARALGFSDRAVTRRIAALNTAPPPHLRPLAAAVLALGVAPALGAADATGDLLSLLQRVFV